MKRFAAVIAAILCLALGRCAPIAISAGMSSSGDHRIIETLRAAAVIDHDRAGTIGLVFGMDLIASSVLEGGPAWEAGIREGDRIVSIDGAAVQGPADIARLCGIPSTSVTVAFSRDGQETTVAVSRIAWWDVWRLPEGEEPRERRPGF